MGQWLPPAQASDPMPLTTRCPPVLQIFQKGVWGGRNPRSLRTRAEGGSELARAAEGSLEGRKGRRRRKGRGRRAGQSNCMFVSAPVSAHEGACAAVGVASPPGVCVCWQRCQGVWALPGPPAPTSCFGERGSGRTQLCSVLMRQMWRGPSCAGFPERGRGCNLLPR